MNNSPCLTDQLKNRIVELESALGEVLNWWSDDDTLNVLDDDNFTGVRPFPIVKSPRMRDIRRLRKVLKK